MNFDDLCVETWRILNGIQKFINSLINAVTEENPILYYFKIDIQETSISAKAMNLFASK